MPEAVPEISVIIPVFNGESTILETDASVQAQDFGNLEIIVINDGSTDNTQSLLESLGEPRLKVFNYENGGVPTSRNRGIDRSRARFLSFLDADDLWTSDKLSGQLEALRKNPAAGAAYSWTSFIDSDGRFLYDRERTMFEGDVHDELLKGNFIASGSNPLLRRECMDAVGRFDPAVPGGADDWDYWLRFSRRWNFVVVPRYHVIYRVHSDSISAKVDNMENGMIEVLNRELRAEPAPPREVVRECKAWIRQYAAFLYLARTETSDALRNASRKLRESIRLHPPLFLERKTQFLLWSIVLLHAIPASLRPRVFRSILRGYGSIMKKLSPA
jgi:glycosyltransferase involved in cell wall biosynthesis